MWVVAEIELTVYPKILYHPAAHSIEWSQGALVALCSTLHNCVDEQWDGLMHWNVGDVLYSCIQEKSWAVWRQGVVP